MLGSRIKKKMLLNYSFCSIFFFFFRRDPKFVVQKIFVIIIIIIIMYFVGARSSFMNIERTRSPPLRSLNRTPCRVYHRRRKALFNI